MLMGFSLDNLAKALILQNSDNADDAFAKEGNLRWTVKNHYLPDLFKAAKFEYNEEELVYLDLWSTCAIWAGRNPIPKNENSAASLVLDVECPLSPFFYIPKRILANTRLLLRSKTLQRK